VFTKYATSLSLAVCPIYASISVHATVMDHTSEGRVISCWYEFTLCKLFNMSHVRD